MKIISKLPDYYDFLVAKFGYDDSRVYDRRNPREAPDSNNKMDCQLIVAITGTEYRVVRYKEKLYHKPSPELDHHDNNFFIYNAAGRATTLNQKYRQPVLIESWYYIGRTQHTYPFIPNLGKLGFAAVVPAEEMYMKIYNYLGWLKDNPEPPNNQTNKEKINFI